MNQKEKKFVSMVWSHYGQHGRHHHPWRKTKNPYKILVSEMMLQQTQVERVIPKYKMFLKTFPTIQELARASLGDVLRVWQGLGYNRRARLLHECAKMVVNEYSEKLPKTHAELLTLPGVGHYTAGAIMAFAYNTAEPIIETNIRSVYIHHFFDDDTDVNDTDIIKLVRKTLDIDNPRGWYYALMDYGVDIKKEFGNPNSRSKHYTKQAPFKGSDREIRGAILRALTVRAESRTSLHKKLSFDIQRIDEQLEKLEREGMIKKKKRKTEFVYTLPE